MTLKVFNLSCDAEHRFEGWFSSQNDFDTQQERGLLQCPLCNSSQVRKLLSAPHLNLSALQEPTPPAVQKQAAVMPTAEQMQAVLMRIAREIAANTEDVGERFAEEARRIHYNEAPERAIRGVTTKEEAEALEDEGIRVMPLPFDSLPKGPVQ